MKKNKIAIARLLLSYDGGFPSRAGVIMGLNPERFRTLFIHLTKCSEEENFFEKKGYKVFYLYGNKVLNAFRLSILRKLVKILKEQKVDILHCHRHKPTVYGTIAAMLAGTPVVISHVHGISRTKNFRRKLTNFFIFRKVNKIITVGEAVRTDVLKTNPFVQPDKVVSVGNSIDYERYADVSLTKAQAREKLALPQDSFVFGTVARMAPNKGQIYLIKAFGKVKHTLPSAHLVFVGDGRLENQLERQAAKTAPNSIHFLGRRDDVPEMLRAMDVYVQPSIGSEGLPKAILEAMAAGVPCVATVIGGIPEIINTADIGYLVPPKDDGALAEAMIKLAKETGEQRKRLVGKAQQRVKNCYTHEVIIRRLEKLYEACMVCN